MRNYSFVLFVCGLMLLAALFFRFSPNQSQRVAANLALSAATPPTNSTQQPLPTLELRDPDPGSELNLAPSVVGEGKDSLSANANQAVSQVAPASSPTVSTQVAPTSEPVREGTPKELAVKVQQAGEAAERANQLLLQAIKAADEAKQQMIIAQRELQEEMRASLNIDTLVARPEKKAPSPTTPKNSPTGESALEQFFAQQTIHFHWMKSTIDTESISKLDAVAQELKKNPEVDIELRGYTDSQGKPELNKWLGLIRARRVRQQLLKRGIAPKRMWVSSGGAENPIDTNDTPQGRWKNRRVEILLSTK